MSNKFVRWVVCAAVLLVALVAWRRHQYNLKRAQWYQVVKDQSDYLGKLNKLILAGEDMGDANVFAKEREEIVAAWAEDVRTATRDHLQSAEFQSAFEAISSTPKEVQKKLAPELLKIREQWTTARIEEARRALAANEYSGAWSSLQATVSEAGQDQNKLANAREEIGKVLREQLKQLAERGQPRLAAWKAHSELSAWIGQDDPLFTGLAEQTENLPARTFGAGRGFDFADAKELLQRLPSDEVVEQLRDWAMLATYTALDPLPTQASLYLGARPHMRLPEYRATGEFDYGQGRIAMLSDEECLILAPTSFRPAEGTKQYAAGLYQLLDSRTSIDGSPPGVVHIAWYSLDEKKQDIKVEGVTTHIGSVLYEPDHGVVTADIESAEELDAFLRKVDAFLSIETKGRQPIDVLRLSGRRYRDGTFALPYHRLTIDDAGVIYRAVFNDTLEEKIVRNHLSQVKELGFDKLSEAEQASIVTSELRALRQDRRTWKTIQEMAAANSELAFSLDPWLDAARLHKRLQHLMGGDESEITYRSFCKSLDWPLGGLLGGQKVT